MRRPRWAHTRQNGSRSSWPGRRSSVHTARLYHPCQAADSLRAACLGLCPRHQPSWVSDEQPGWRHGRNGFCATGYHLRAKQKPAPTTTLSGRSQHGLQEHWPCSIFTSVVLLHRRQYAGIFFPLVCGVTDRVVGLLHTGHRTLPPAVISIPRFSFACNTFPSAFTYSVRLIRVVSSSKIIRASRFSTFRVTIFRGRLIRKQKIPGPDTV